MPVLVLAARLCPPGVEATLFALLMSIYNLAGFLSYESGALLMHWLSVDETNFTNLWIVVVITNLTTLLPLPLIGWLPGADEDQDDGALPGASVSILQTELVTAEKELVTEL
jgi:hypothetical protein